VDDVETAAEVRDRYGMESTGTLSDPPTPPGQETWSEEEENTVGGRGQ